MPQLLHDITVDIEVECAKCGHDLDVTITNHYGVHTITVEPCSSCLEKAENDGYQDGLNDGGKE